MLIELPPADVGIRQMMALEQSAEIIEITCYSEIVDKMPFMF